MHIVFGTALLIIAVLLIVGILSRRHWISTVLAVAIALIGGRDNLHQHFDRAVIRASALCPGGSG